MKKVILFIVSSALLMACTQNTKTAKLSDVAKVADEYVVKIKALEAKIDPTNIETFMQIGDSVSLQKQLADSAIQEVYETLADTTFLSFVQTANLDKIEIQKVWLVGAKYNEVFIEARVRALDNSSLKGPYTSLSVFDAEENNVGAGGGIAGSPDAKLQAGKVYIFSGKIDNLNKLTSVKKLMFDEDIKKW